MAPLQHAALRVGLTAQRARAFLLDPRAQWVGDRSFIAHDDEHPEVTAEIVDAMLQKP